MAAVLAAKSHRKAAFKAEAGKLYGSQKLLHDARASEYTRMAKDNKLRPSLVVRDYTSTVDDYLANMKKDNPAPASTAQTQYDGVPPGFVPEGG